MDNTVDTRRWCMMDGWMDGSLTTSPASNGHIEVIQDSIMIIMCMNRLIEMMLIAVSRFSTSLVVRD